MSCLIKKICSSLQEPVSTIWDKDTETFGTNERRHSITLASLNVNEDYDKDNFTSTDFPLNSGSQTRDATQTIDQSPQKLDVVSDGMKIQLSSMASQTDDLLCLNCGCSVCGILDEINAKYSTDFLQTQEVLSDTAPELEADQTLELCRSPDLSIYQKIDCNKSGQSDSKESVEGQSSDVFKACLSPCNIERYQLDAGCDFLESETNACPGMDKEHQKCPCANSSLSGEQTGSVPASCVDGEDLLETLPHSLSPISPCVIQTRSKTAKRGKAK